MSEQTTIGTKNDYIINSADEPEVELDELNMLMDSEESCQAYLQECLREIYQPSDINSSKDLSSIAAKMIKMGCNRKVFLRYTRLLARI